MPVRRDLGGIAIALGLAGCLRTPVHHCDGDEDCPGGTCAVTEAGDLRCTVETPDCDSGAAWADDAGDLAGDCIDPEATTAAVCLAHGVERPADSCAAIVCMDQPRCCSHEWGEACVRTAEQVCGAACGAIAAFFGDGLLWVGAWDGSGFAPFWTEDGAAGTFYVAAAWGDVDGDLAPELAVCGSAGGTSRVTVYGNDGAEGLTAGTPADVTVSSCRDLDFVDLDADGDLDLVVTGGPDITVLDLAGGEWVPRSAGLSTESSWDVDWADVDGDGRLDAAVAHFETTVRVLRNGATGFELLWESGQIGSLLGYSNVAWAELDDVEGIDLFIAGDYALEVVPDRGDSGFLLDEAATIDIGPQSGGMESARLLDGDGDGDLDAVAFYNQEAAEMYENLAPGGFGAAAWWSSGAAPFSVDAWSVRSAVGDVDGDRVHDLVACGHMTPCHLWLGDGAGALIEQVGAAPAEPLLYGVALTGDWRAD